MQGRKVSEYVMQKYITEYKDFIGRKRADFIHKAYGNDICKFAELGYDTNSFFNDLLQGKELKYDVENTNTTRLK
ncbi:MAG TPA: hypothetical protein PLX95_03895 [bacterium]|nr:hypothetical protein [bacterium]